MKKQFLALGLFTVIAVPAFAEGIYVFGDIGQSKIEIDWSNHSESNTSYSLGLGYAFNKNFAFEVGYRDLGKITLFTDEFATANSDGSVIQASLLAKYPINDKVNIFGRLGFAGVTYDYKYQAFANSDNHFSSSDEQNKGVFGIGADYSINEHLSLRTEYNQYGKFESLETSTLTVGAVYSF